MACGASIRPPNGAEEVRQDPLDPPGAASFRDMRARAVELQLETTVLVVGLDDLIAIKRASGRSIDRSDILAVTEPD
jgi:hypothetical protein